MEKVRRPLLFSTLCFLLSVFCSAGCRFAADAAGTTSGQAGQVQTFIGDFVHQALAAFVL